MPCHPRPNGGACNRCWPTGGAYDICQAPAFAPATAPPPQQKPIPRGGAARADAPPAFPLAAAPHSPMRGLRLALFCLFTHAARIGKNPPIAKPFQPPLAALESCGNTPPPVGERLAPRPDITAHAGRAAL